MATGAKWLQFWTEDEGLWQMKTLVSFIALTLAISTAPNPAEAKGCLTGALAGAVAGHYAGRHSHILTGAIAGCYMGHRVAKYKQQQRERQAPPVQGNEPSGGGL
jgi:fructose-specific phosphotransferase system IIC component